MKKLKTILLTTLVTLTLGLSVQAFAAGHGAKGASTAEAAGDATTNCFWYYIPGWGWICF